MVLRLPLSLCSERPEERALKQQFFDFYLVTKERSNDRPQRRTIRRRHSETSCTSNSEEYGSLQQGVAVQRFFEPYLLRDEAAQRKPAMDRKPSEASSTTVGSLAEENYSSGAIVSVHKAQFLSDQQDMVEDAPVKKTRRREGLQVRFSELCIREYPILLGDNPGGTSGPPLTIDWDYAVEQVVVIDVDSYEASRPPRRGQAQLQIPASTRRDMLREAGYSRMEIVEGTKPVNIARRQRVRTREQLALQPVNELVEKISRQAQTILTFGANKRNERKLLEPYVAFAKAKQSLGHKADKVPGEFD